MTEPPRFPWVRPGTMGWLGIASVVPIESLREAAVDLDEQEHLEHVDLDDTRPARWQSGQEIFDHLDVSKVLKAIRSGRSLEQLCVNFEIPEWVAKLIASVNRLTIATKEDADIHALKIEKAALESELAEVRR